MKFEPGYRDSNIKSSIDILNTYGMETQKLGFRVIFNFLCQRTLNQFTKGKNKNMNISSHIQQRKVCEQESNLRAWNYKSSGICNHGKGSF